MFQSNEQTVQFLKEEIAAVIKQSPSSLEENVSFLKLGLDSLQTIMILNKIKKKLNLDINPIAMFEYKNIAELSVYLDECFAESLECNG